MGDLSSIIRFQRHYRRQLDSKNNIIQDHLRRQRIYLTRLREFISRVPSPLRQGRYEQLMTSLEKLEVHFFESQEDFCNLQCVIHSLDSVTTSEDRNDSPSSSVSYGPPSIHTSVSNSSYLPSSQTTSNSDLSFQCGNSCSDSNSFSTFPSASSSSPSSDNSPQQPQQSKRKRRRVSRQEEGSRSVRTATSPSSRAHAPRPASSSSDTANSPPSPTSNSHVWPAKAKKRNNFDSLESSFLNSKRVTASSELSPLTEDGVLPDFSLYG